MFIVYYHNVITTDMDEFDKRLSRIHLDKFVSQMKYLAANFKPISLDHMLLQLETGACDENAIAITFDDGYYGVLKNALPVLDALHIPATVFVVTGHADFNSNATLLHFDEVEIAFRLTKVSRIDLGFIGEGARSLRSTMDRVSCMKEAKRKLKLSPQQRELQEALIERLEVTREEILAYSKDREKFRTLNWEEIRQLMRAAVAIGSHTRSHRTLSQLSGEDLDVEIKISLEELRRGAGVGLAPFAYPYGGLEHIGELASTKVKQAGYSCGLTTIPGRNRPGGDVFMLHRMEFAELRFHT